MDIKNSPDEQIEALAIHIGSTAAYRLTDKQNKFMIIDYSLPFLDENVIPEVIKILEPFYDIEQISKAILTVQQKRLPRTKQSS